MDNVKIGLFKTYGRCLMKLLCSVRITDTTSLTGGETLICDNERAEN